MVSKTSPIALLPASLVALYAGMNLVELGNVLSDCYTGKRGKARLSRDGSWKICRAEDLRDF